MRDCCQWGSVFIVPISSELGYHIGSDECPASPRCPLCLGLMEVGKGTNFHLEPRGVKARSGSIKQTGFCGVEERIQKRSGPVSNSGNSRIGQLVGP